MKYYKCESSIETNASWPHFDFKAIHAGVLSSRFFAKYPHSKSDGRSKCNDFKVLTTLRQRASVVKTRVIEGATAKRGQHVPDLLPASPLTGPT